jgi:hypothetical protein
MASFVFEVGKKMHTKKNAAMRPNHEQEKKERSCQVTDIQTPINL